MLVYEIRDLLNTFLVTTRNLVKHFSLVIFIDIHSSHLPNDVTDT